MDKAGEKLGLCLSGGGFRAALFHIGTLAALAERGLLHKVEVLSTVSGGSIIGAYYYLKVKQLLEGGRADYPLPEPAAYIVIVKEIERDFLAAVQQNLRVRLLSNPYKTAKMLLIESYSRSDRMAELLDKYFYDSVAGVERIKLKDIHIKPPHAVNLHVDDGRFSARIYNANEACKIPVLTINATCLNTGHPWEFTGSWVGEPARRELYEREQNSIAILPQLRFDGTFQDDRTRKIESWQLEKLDSIWLSDAVAASAAVPAVFPPLPIHDLYRNSVGGELVVELSDGGVFDNQGLAAVLSAKCTHIIVSDASGQIVDESLLSTSMVGVAQRANDVMMERIRGYGYFDMGLRREVFPKISATDPLHNEIYFVQDRAYAHLREVAANGAALPGPGDSEGGMVYSLSRMRTDLDAFSDMEACALMYQAHALATQKLQAFCLECAPGMPKNQPWRFLEMAAIVKDEQARLVRHLGAARAKFFKTYCLAPVRSWAWLLFLLSPFIAAALYWLNECWTKDIVITLPVFTVRELFVYALVALVALLPMSATVRKGFKTVKWLRILVQNPMTNVGVQIMGAGVTLVAMLGWAVVFIHLVIYNPLFLRVGKLKCRDE